MLNLRKETNGTITIRRTKAQGNAIRNRKTIPEFTVDSGVKRLRKPETRKSLFRDACNERGRGLC